MPKALSHATAFPSTFSKSGLHIVENDRTDVTTCEVLIERPQSWRGTDAFDAGCVVMLIARTSHLSFVDCMSFLAALVPQNSLTPSKDFFWCQKQMLTKKFLTTKQRTSLEFEKLNYRLNMSWVKSHSMSRSYFQLL